MLNQVVSARKAIAVLADASLHWAVLEDRVVDAGLVPLQVRRSSERPAAFTDVGLHRSRQRPLTSLRNEMAEPIPWVGTYLAVSHGA